MLIPYLTFADPTAAIDLYTRALGAKPGMILDGPDGIVLHAEMALGDYTLMLSSEFPEISSAPSGRSPVNFMLYVDDVDAAYAKAVDAGMASEEEPEDRFWGDRTAKVSDGMGYEWTLATTFEEVSAEEMERRGAAWASEMGG